ncbi:flagellar protein FliT [Ralstonia solanacearum]|uniref:Flagellar protein FliT n=1 Tax=Ralstonia syzygii TaxID=28097 RepID=A0ABX7ZCD0_9RALS|nr:flagellar protein FliT [Ralstonia syzygii]AXW61009.1 flagellar protein FliT [Ralstonia solanacearum]QUP52724.1 flagellar protein FliT [Ralstonia syzygii]
MSRTLATTRTPRPQQGSDTLFASYEAIACLSEEMVGAAEAGDWAGVSALERECAVYMERLGRSPSRPVLSQAELQRKRDLMIRILANDARVRALVCPRQDQLLRPMDAARRSIGARQAYAAVSYY